MEFEDRWTRGKTFSILLVFQTLFVVLFAVFLEYTEDAHPYYVGKGSKDNHATPLEYSYPMFQDVHVMIFIGFGFLMTFLKRYGYSAVGLNILVAAFVLQWATIVAGFFHLKQGKIYIDINTMLTADFAAATVLISFGAVIGKASLVQVIVMAFIEIVVFQCNEVLGAKVLQASDVGGSMFVHVFGAYFGLAVARVLYNDDLHDEIHDHHKWAPCYHSDQFSMIGSIFLWVYWPSFNSAVANGPDARYRAVINTYYALAACVVMSFAMSSLVDKKNRFSIDHIQNATIAAGVAVGTSADMLLYPYGAAIVGCVAGAICVLGLRFLEDHMAVNWKLHDTCGVNNLHGMPGLLAGIVGAILAALASEDNYGKGGLYRVFPARAPVNGSSDKMAEILHYASDTEPGLGRSSIEQGGYQMAALVITLAVAVVSGTITGFILKLPIWDQPTGEHLFDDDQMWLLPDDYTGIDIKNNAAIWDHMRELSSQMGYKPQNDFALKFATGFALGRPQIGKDTSKPKETNNITKTVST